LGNLSWVGSVLMTFWVGWKVCGLDWFGLE